MKNKASRQCLLHNNGRICPSCCASLRSESCASCSYYKVSQNYWTEKLQQSADMLTGDYLWHKMRKTEGELMTRLLDYARERFGEPLMLEALKDFFVWPEEPGDPDEYLSLEHFFNTWFVFNWKPEPRHRSSGSMTIPDKKIALCYLDEHKNSLSDFQQQFILRASASPYSFFVITNVMPGQSTSLRDIFLQRDYVVKERSASQSKYKGSIIYSRIVTIDDTSIMLGAGSLVFPPSYQLHLIDLREQWGKNHQQLTTEFLDNHDNDLRAVYFEFDAQLRNPSFPVLKNTDGDLFEVVDLHYDLRCTPHEAFEKLRPLRLDDADEEFLENALFNKDGSLEEIAFPWLIAGNKMNPSWDNTIMGNLKIRGASLTIEVNSQNRAKKIKKLLKKYLGDKAVYKTAVIQSAVSLAKQARPQPSSRKDRDKELEKPPEVQAVLKEMARKHWESWIDQKIPALGNKTPRQAAKTALGREKLEVLLRDMEIHYKEETNPLRPDFTKLREILGL